MKVNDKISMINLTKGFAVIVLFLICSYGSYEFYDDSILLPIGLCVLYPLIAALFVSSGYRYKSQSLKEIFKRLLKKPLLIYCITGLVSVIAVGIVGLIDAYYDKAMVVESLRGTFLGFLLGVYDSTMIGDISIYSIDAMWIVVANVLGILALHFLLKIKFLRENKIATMVVVFLTALAGMMLDDLSCVYCLPQVLVSIQALYYGYLIKETDFIGRGWKSKEYFTVLGGTLITAVLYGGFILIKGIDSIYGITAMLLAIPVGVVIMKLLNLLVKTNSKILALIKLIGADYLIVIMLISIEQCAFSGMIEKLIYSSLLPKAEIISATIYTLVKGALYVVIIIAFELIKHAISNRHMKDKTR